jgi:aldose 1-epimerase
LHGGQKGFDKVVWDAKPEGNSITFTYVSPEWEEGYPGTLTAVVKYTLTDSNEFKIEYAATTDKPTIINLSQHSYFNLSGEGSPTVLDHILEINADKFTPVDTMLIPTGELTSVENSPFDFRKPKQIGLQVNDTADAQLKYAGGYDHNWILKKDSTELSLAARLIDTTSGRVMEVYTTEPGIQFYSGNFLNGETIGKSGKAYQHRSAVALETQHFPDSPNHANFPTTFLNPGQKYTQTCIYKFTVLKARE